MNHEHSLFVCFGNKTLFFSAKDSHKIILLIVPSVISLCSGPTISADEFIELQRKVIEKDKTIVDLEGKLDTLKAKRQEDKYKMKDLEKARMQLEQVFTRKTTGLYQWFLLLTPSTGSPKKNKEFFVEERTFYKFTKNLISHYLED